MFKNEKVLVKEPVTRHELEEKLNATEERYRRQLDRATDLNMKVRKLEVKVKILAGMAFNRKDYDSVEQMMIDVGKIAKGRFVDENE